MLPSEVPLCPFCNCSEFKPGGSHISPGLSQQGFRCVQCGTHVELMSMGKCQLATFFHPSSLIEGPDGDHTFPKEYMDWANSTLLPTWRHHRAEVKAHEKLEWSKWVEEVFNKEFPEYVDFRQNNMSYYDLSGDAQAAIDKVFGGTQGPQKIGEYLPLPEDLQEQPYPPQMPDIEGVQTTYWKGTVWLMVSPEFSQTLKAPEDPILVNNRNFFSEVWAAVGTAVGDPIPEREEIKNQYGGKAPWYTFNAYGATITAGWRKRVVSIQVVCPKGILTAEIKTLADRDKTTYIAEGPLITRTAEDVECLLRPENITESMLQSIVANHRTKHPDGEQTREGGWKDDRPVAHALEIHAWGKDRAVEYLTTLCQTLRDAA